jgi:hypothetical protein
MDFFGVLQEVNLSTMQTFDLKRSQPLPPMLLPYLRLAYSTTEEQVHKVRGRAVLCDTFDRMTVFLLTG